MVPILPDGPRGEWKSRWMLDADSVVFDMSIAKRSFGAYLRRTSSISEQRWSEAGQDTALAKGRSMTFDSLAILRTDAQWNRMRTVPLLDTEAGIFEMTDSIMSLPQWRFVKSAGYFLGSGFVLAGPLEVGAWWSAYTRNPTGNRFRLDSNVQCFQHGSCLRCSPRHGTYDQRWKAGIAADLIFRKTPRTEAFSKSNTTSSNSAWSACWSRARHLPQCCVPTPSTCYRKSSARRRLCMNSAPDSAFFEWRHRVGGRGEWNFLNPERASHRAPDYHQQGALFAKGERFVGGEFVRRSLGTEWPVLDATVTWAMPNVLGSQYNYTLAPWRPTTKSAWGGGGEWNGSPLQASILVRRLPVDGSRAGKRDIFHDGGGVQHAALFGRVTDEWVSANIEWHGEGILFNHLPAPAARLREVIGVKESPATGTHATKHYWNCRKKPRDSTGPTPNAASAWKTYLVFCALMGCGARPALGRSGQPGYSTWILGRHLTRQRPYFRPMKTADTPATLRAEGLVKQYGKRRVVDGVSLEVNPGEVVGLLGPNGAGKTTSFYAVVGLVQPDAGRVCQRPRGHGAAHVQARADGNRIPVAGSLGFSKAHGGG